MASTSESKADATPTTERPTVIVCVGMAGSGKTTFMRRINSHLHSKGSPPYVINLDPATLEVPFDCNIDIRQSIKYKDVMKHYNLGPNGAIMTSLNLFATKVDQMVGLLEKRAKPDPEHPERKPVKHIIVDTPGQIEVFVWSASGQILLESLASSFPTVLAYIIDTPRTTSTSTFMSNMLYACSILYKTKLPMILVFNKTDVKDASFAKEWMTDYEALREALADDELRAETEGAESGSGYSSSLLSSMSLVLEEFYSHLSVVGVSSRVGTGVAEFFEAVKEKAEEFERDYQPELDRLRTAKEEEKVKKRERELEKMMKGMSVQGGESDLVSKIGSVDVVEDSGDEEYEDEEGGSSALQDRYKAALGGGGDSVEAEASYAKYLHSQRQ
ncbi:GTPase npa3 [Scedosporium apiospermum]|uniref:GPN-loop GTPase n=1 Tax=Pseudallescheria apiosperma TaxID=563466 RepID=A0A084GHH0_PSEDA|nr:GTPase npa3 [Scedosporium apiospermum]KEZ46782.1 GTPase npa3 [Scedosporium apiospermum]